MVDAVAPRARGRAEPSWAGEAGRRQYPWVLASPMTPIQRRCPRVIRVRGVTASTISETVLGGCARMCLRGIAQGQAAAGLTDAARPELRAHRRADRRARRGGGDGTRAQPARRGD